MCSNWVHFEYVQIVDTSKHMHTDSLLSVLYEALSIMSTSSTVATFMHACHGVKLHAL